jgi:hypothetical protein
MHLLESGFLLAGCTDISTSLGQLARDAGFVEVTTHIKKLPWAPWPSDPRMKELGYWALLSLSNSGFEAFGMALFTRFHGMSAAEAKQVCDDAWKDVWNKHIHVYHTQWVCTLIQSDLRTDWWCRVIMVARKPY